jgi:hypothetical protein
MSRSGEKNDPAQKQQNPLPQGQWGSLRSATQWKTWREGGLFLRLILTAGGAVLTLPSNFASANESTATRAVSSTSSAAVCIQRLLTPSAPQCPGLEVSPLANLASFIPSRSVSDRLVLAARTTMAVQYQSCEAPFLPPIDPLHTTSGFTETANPLNAALVIRAITDVDEYTATHPILSELPADRPSACRDITVAPPMYLFGAKPRILPGPPPAADLFVDQSRHSLCIRPSGEGYNGAACATGRSPGVTGMDCSGFISLILMNSGLRASRDTNPSLISTSQLVAAARSSRSCFASVDLNQARNSTSLLVPGDIYVVGGQHVVMVESTGTDPFGLDRLPSMVSCEALTPADWDFQIIHSSSRGGAAGISRMNASEFFLEAPEFAGPLIAQAQEACRIRRARAAPREALSSSSSFIPETDVGDAATGAPSSSSLLIRHGGATRPGCETPPEERLSFEGVDCLAGCNLLPPRRGS